MLYEFFGTECPHCLNMKSIVEQLKSEGVQVESYEVWHNNDNAHKLEQFDEGHCGGVPFFINPNTKKWICGEATFEELKAIATE
ncbi:MAG: hypothetical protein AAB783_00090 [Patescibacteria group bacterium]